MCASKWLQVKNKTTEKNKSPLTNIRATIRWGSIHPPEQPKLWRLKSKAEKVKNKKKSEITDN